MAKAKKFGAFSGVFTPSILTLLGVIMYLRLPWIIGQAGLWATLGIILVAHLVTICTGLSVASIATDKRIETGGTYYIISRSLGLPIGGTLGWSQFTGLSLAVSLYLIGFAQVLLGLLGIEVTIDNIRIMGSIALFAVLIITFISASLTIKTQFIMLGILVLSLLSIFLGNHNLQPEVPQLAAIPESLPWIALFAIFFPAVTGFESGVSMSGDLRDARKDIPKGIMWAILLAMLIYIALTFFLSYTVDREQLVNNPNILFNIALSPQMVMIGILGASLSAGLGSILAAPRILQAIAKDRIAPKFFAKGYGASNEPRNALIFSYLIAQVGILIGDLNTIARLVSIFFIISYGFINITYTIESWVSSDFRPSFKIPKIVSIIGALASIVIMIQLDIVVLAVATLLLSVLFLYLRRKEINLSAGDSRSSIWHTLVKMGLTKLAKSDLKSRNWRPNIIVFSGGATKRPHLTELATDLVGRLGIFTNFELYTKESKSEQEDEQEEIVNPLMNNTAQILLENTEHSKDIITRKHQCNDIYEGIGLISSVYGFSGFEPNTLLMGWPKEPFANPSFVPLLQSLIKQDYSIALLKYNPVKGFGKCKNIDIWWQGGERTLPLALHLASFLTSIPKWRRANLRILTLCKQPRLRDRYYATTSGLLADFRLDATVKIVENPSNLDIGALIKSHCAESDLIITDIAGVQENASTAVAHTDLIAKAMGTVLFIEADSSFDPIPTIKESNVEREQQEITLFDLESNLKAVPESLLPQVEPFNSKTRALLDQHIVELNSLVIATIENIKGDRELFLNTLEEDISSREVGSHLATALLKITEEYRKDTLKQQAQEMEREVNEYITSLNELLKKLPQSFTLKFEREDFEKIESKGFWNRVDRRVKIAKSYLFGREIKVKIRSGHAAHHYLYYKRLDSINDFYNHFAQNSFEHLLVVKDLESLIITADSYAMVKESIKSAKDANNNFASRYQEHIVGQLYYDIREFAQLMHSPQANLQSRKLASLNKKSSELLNNIEEFPAEWMAKMESAVNRIKIDLLYLELKEKIGVSLNNLYRNINDRVAKGLIKNIDELDKESDNLESLPAGAGLKFYAGVPMVDSLFYSLKKEIVEYTKGLIESISIRAEEQEYTVQVRKIADYYITNELVERIEKESFALVSSLNESVASLRNMVKLANFTLENELEKALTIQEREERRTLLLKNIKMSLKGEKERILRAVESLKSSLESGVVLAFEPLTSVSVVENGDAHIKKRREQRGGRVVKESRAAINRFMSKLRTNFVDLLYSQSEGILWAGRISGKNYRVDRGSSLEKGSAFIDRGVLDLLPFYYITLFEGKSGVSEDFWIGMESEKEQGRAAIKKFMFGMKGTLLIAGERRSGKSSLSRNLAKSQFGARELFSVTPPKESDSNVALFERALFNSIVEKGAGDQQFREYEGGESLNALLSSIGSKCVVVMNDLELWWERKPGGTAVIERVIEIIQNHGRNLLFIINVNIYALDIINSLTHLNTWAIDIITCKPFPAKMLKEFIIARHKAGGLKFVMGSKPEDQMTEWDYARLFNHIFNISGGNPGYSIILWLGAINNISGETIYMNRPVGLSEEALGNLNQQEAIVLLQFVLHRRFSAQHLAQILMSNQAYIESTIRILKQRGLLVEKLPNVYSLNPMLVPYIIKRLKSKHLL